MKELVSVIIPTYGGGEYLKRAVDSVLAQTYDNLEVIVVDDNGLGTPNQNTTQSVMSEYEGNERVRYVCHDVNKNGSAARNTGVRESTGKYIALLDDDDEYVNTKIEKLVECIERESEVALVFGNAIGYDGERQVYSNKAFVPDSPLYGILMHQFSIGTSAFLIRRDAYLCVGGFDEEFKRHQDWEFFCKVIAHYQIKAVDTPASIRHLTRRNQPKSADVALEYRRLYLQKMSPYIEQLSDKEQKDVRIYNELEVIIKYIRERRFKDFISNYKALHPGIKGLKFFVKRIRTIIKRGSITGMG